ncbi:hypothetical protein PINS_up003992 [Pythium insidiosum]|nr:hypothetical protein PINS_up003992 [Pythium insidiosum]
MDNAERWVRETFAPVVLTCTTPEVERLAFKNNISLADLLNAGSMLAGVDTPLRSVAHALHLRDFYFRFIGARSLALPSLADSTRLLNEVVLRHPPAAAQQQQQSHSSSQAGVIDLALPPVRCVDDVAPFLRVVGAAQNAEPLPWYREFKRALFDSLRCEEFSMLSQPIAMLLVVSSTESNPRASFEQLGASQQLPPAFLSGQFDPAIPKFYLVLHDVAEADGTTIDPDAILRNLQIPSTAGAVLRINSLPLDTPTAENTATYATHPYVGSTRFPGNGADSNYPFYTEHLGGFLSTDDMTRIRTFAHGFGLRFVLPALENRIFQLNEIVSAMKKGVKNVFKSWLRKPKDLSARVQSPSGGAITYRCDSIEAQTRLLADTALMVGDFELALQMYRLARDDYKSDKSMLHTATVNEMIALCLLLTKGSPMQMTNALEAATATYYKVTHPLATRLAVRGSVIAGEIFNTLSHSGLFTDYMDNASAALIRGSTMEQGICSAVLMERAAMCDIQARQPKFRKFGFRMVMAGHVYDSLGLSAHSARCYSLARAVYDCSGWFQVEDHINFTLAQQSNRLNDPIASINLFLKLIGTGRNSASQQEALLYEFGMVVKEFLSSGAADGYSQTSGPRNGSVVIKQVGPTPESRKLVVRDLCMPELDDKSTVVFAPGNATGINRDIDGSATDADAWRELEQVFVKQNQVHRHVSQDAVASSHAKNPWLAPVHAYNLPYRGKKGAQHKKPEQYAVGERIYVEFEMKNALSCAVDVENIHLFGTFEPVDGESFEISNAYDASDDRIAVEHVNLQLLPVSEERVRLSACPKIPGTLRIAGIRWSICGGDVHGEHAFDIPGPLLQDTRANKEARARAPNTTLIADVVGEMPWLGVTVTPAVTTDAFVGELMRWSVELENSGTATLGGLQLCCTDVALCGALETKDGGARTQLGYVGANGQVLDLNDLRLEPGEKSQLVLWARGTISGRRPVRLLFKYKREAAGSDWENALTRATKVKIDLNLLPSVDVSYSVDSSYGVAGEYVLGLTVANQRRDANPSSSDGNVQLERLVCVSNHWQIEPFPHVASSTTARRNGSQLGAGEASTTYFRISAKRDGAVDTTSSAVQLNASSKVSDLGLPVEQHLCLDHALELVRTAESASAEGAGAAGDRPGGMRSIQSVRRENKAMKNNGQDAPTDASATAQAPPPQPSPQPTSTAALLHSMDVDAHLLVLWSTTRNPNNRPSDKLTAIGQHNLTSLRVRSPLKMNGACPLTMALAYPEQASLRQMGPHGPSLAEVDVLVTVRNESLLSSPAIDFTMEMLPPEEVRPAVTSTALYQLAPSPHFFWSGLTKKHVSRFAPGASITMKLKACFMTAGVYDLNRFRFTVSTSDTSGASSTFVFPVEYLIHVQSGSAESTEEVPTQSCPVDVVPPTTTPVF